MTGTDKVCLQDVNTQVARSLSEETLLECGDLLAYIEAEHHTSMSKHSFQHSLQKLLTTVGTTVYQRTPDTFCNAPMEWVQEQVQRALSNEWVEMFQSVQVERPPVPGKNVFVFMCRSTLTQGIASPGAGSVVPVTIASQYALNLARWTLLA